MTRCSTASSRRQSQTVRWMLGCASSPPVASLPTSNLVDEANIRAVATPPTAPRHSQAQRPRHRDAFTP